MQKTIVKYVSGISDDATYFQKKMHRKYNGKIGYVRRNIDFDIKHGVTKEEVIAFLDKSKMTPHFLIYEKAKVAKKESKNCR
jgi:ABC-type Mn2+/Zn2+ transport system ATPase subunit